MADSKLKVKFEVPNATTTSIRLEVRPSDAVVAPSKSNAPNYEFPVESERKYTLRWRAKGAQGGSEYTIQITAPKEAEFDPSPRKRATASGNIVGQKTFTIG